MKIIEQAERNAELIIPKLEAVKQRIGSGRIHDVDVYLSTLTGTRMSLQESGNEEIAKRLLYEVGQAERFLKSVVLRGH